MSKLFNVYFKGCTDIERNYEGTTDNFKLWLKKHNEERDEQEFEDDFEVEGVCLVLFEDKDLSSKESKSWIITESKDSGRTVNDQ